MGSKMVPPDLKTLLKILACVCLIGGAFLLGTLTNSKGGPSEDSLEKDIRKTRSVRASRSGPESTDVRTQTPKPDGAVYIRWGRTTCPSEASIIYSGVIGGGLDGHTGGGSEYVCLPGSPEYGKFQAGANAYNYIYGAEFMAYSGLFNTANMYSFTHQNAACVACLSIRNSKIMIPGRLTCYGDWTKEYRGVLMSSKHTDKSGKNYICMDVAPEADRGGEKSEGGAKLWPVEGLCGSLPCPPYENGKELACVVCTR